MPTTSIVEELEKLGGMMHPASPSQRVVTRAAVELRRCYLLINWLEQNQVRSPMEPGA